MSPDPTGAGFALNVVNASKKFRLQTEPTNSLKATLTGFHRAAAKDFWAVKDVTMTIPRGSMTGIVGRNGSGKSTLLRLMCGVYAPTEGYIDVNGRITALLELGAGFHGELSGRENIFMNAAVMGIAPDKAKEAVDDIIKLADIGSFIDNPVDIYSSGMRARLGFAVSVFLDPEILLADEIVAVGDVGFAKNCFDHMNRMRREGVTIVLVSHNLGLMESMSDQVAWIHDGALQLLGDPKEVTHTFRDFMTGGIDLDEGLDRDEPDNPITHLEASSEDGIVMGYTGAPLNVRVGYDFTEPVVGPRVRLMTHHPDGPVYVGAETDDALGPRLEGKGTFDYHVPVLPIGPGQYSVEVTILDEAGNVRATRRCRLPIRPMTELEPQTYVDMGGRWFTNTPTS